MILLIDNYDSFSYNLYQLVGEINSDIKVIRNDELTLNEIKQLQPEKIILSPGPGRPEAAGIIIDIVKTFGAHIPILGVCLGHQAICAAFGGKVTYAQELMHGKQSLINIDEKCELFEGISKNVLVARYHSLVADKSSIPNELKITASTSEGEVMAVKHKKYSIYGVQFHPESILTPDGRKMLENFLKGE